MVASVGVLLQLGVLSGDAGCWFWATVPQGFEPGREPGDFPPSDDLVLVAPSETMLGIDEFGGGPKDLPPRGRERAAEAVVEREGGFGDRTSEGGIGVGEEPFRGRGTHRVPGEATSLHPRLPATATGGVMDRQHTGGEIQRLGGVGTLQTPGDELVATRGAGLGRAGSRAAER